MGVKLEDLANEAPKFHNMSLDEYIDTLAIWLRDRVGVYTPDLLVALIVVLSQRDRRLRFVTRHKVLHRISVLEKKGLLRVRRL